MTAVAMLASSLTFADTASSGSGKSSTQLKALGSAFRSHSTVVPTINPNDITMGYAGEDVARKITTAAQIAL
ncbi:hypothetical protein [Aquicella siphonis]|nr:hypothetical protein [Aquicella siphonis]